MFKIKIIMIISAQRGEESQLHEIRGLPTSPHEGLFRSHFTFLSLQLRQSRSRRMPRGFPTGLLRC